MIIYIDSCSICRPFDDQNQLRIKLESESVLFILEEIQKGNYKWIISEVLEFELSNIADEEKRNKVISILDSAKKVINFNKRIEEKGDEIYNLSFDLMDSYHIASAIIGNASYFISTDYALVKKGQKNADKLGIEFINPIELINLQGV